MWNSNILKQDEDSWEVRAFEEDTNHAMGTTWPPRSYTCAFCRREFRSAQALGGHMNVHRRDRAQLHRRPPTPAAPSMRRTPQEFVAAAANAGLCFLYSLQNPNPNDGGVLGRTESCSPDLLSISRYQPTNLMTSVTVPFFNFPAENSTVLSYYSVNNELPSASSINNNNHGSIVEEIDLELRLGHSSSSSS